MVGMAEIKVAGPGQPSRPAPSVLTALGLGSCIGICAYDRVARIAGMAHVVLPESGGGQAESPGKFADTAIPALLEEMRRLGAIPARLSIAIAGGAQLFSFGAGASRLEIGARNAQRVLEGLQKHRLEVSAKDVGGNAGRTVQLFVEDGRVRVKTIGRGEADLALLGQLGHRETALRAA
jgi:chemotaxis protein CheD